MAILDIFKSKEGKKKEEILKPEQKPVKKEAPKATGKRARAFVLKSPHVTEKATNLTEDNKYVFNVDRSANKIEVRRAVESLYGVKVEGVAIIVGKRKKKRVGRHIGHKPGYKKAIVKVKKGQKIEIMPK